MPDPFRDAAVVLDRAIALAEENGRLKGENERLRERIAALEAKSDPVSLGAEVHGLVEEREALTSQLNELRARIEALAVINDDLSKLRPGDPNTRAIQLTHENRRLRERIKAYEERDALERDALERDRLLRDE